jgi:hypothetical protein
MPNVLTLRGFAQQSYCMKRWLKAIWCLLLMQSSIALQFKADGTFKVLQLTDLHFGQDEMDDVQTLQVSLEKLYHAGTHSIAAAQTGGHACRPPDALR